MGQIQRFQRYIYFIIVKIQPFLLYNPQINNKIASENYEFIKRLEPLSCEETYQGLRTYGDDKTDSFPVIRFSNLPAIIGI